jgi:hypothetical protein
MLLAGLLLGAAAEKYSARSAGHAAGQSVAARSPQGAASPPPAPDTLFPGTDDAWDPFREMRDLQAQMDKMFQRSISRFNASPISQIQ